MLGALLADGAGLHRLAYYLVLLAVIGAAGAAFLGAADAIEGKPGALLRAVSSSLALVFLVAAAISRSNMVAGASVPKLAVSGAVAAVVVYTLPLLGWLLEPLRPQPRTRARSRAVRVRTDP